VAQPSPLQTRFRTLLRHVTRYRCAAGSGTEHCSVLTKRWRNHPPYILGSEHYLRHVTRYRCAAGSGTAAAFSPKGGATIPPYILGSEYYLRHVTRYRCSKASGTAARGLTRRWRSRPLCHQSAVHMSPGTCTHSGNIRETGAKMLPSFPGEDGQSNSKLHRESETSPCKPLKTSRKTADHGVFDIGRR
jgi:hypothetical protein